LDGASCPLSIRRIIAAVLLLAVLSSITSCKKGNKGDKTYMIGYMICNNTEETNERFLPITNYLTEKTGYKFEMIAVNTQDFAANYSEKKFDFTHTNSYLFTMLRNTLGVKYLCTEKRGAYGPRTKGVLFALRSSNINSYADIKDKRVLFGPVFAPFAFITQYSLLTQNGVDPENDIIYAIPWGSFKHDKVIYGVLFNDYDVGGVSSLDLELMAKSGKINIDNINIIAESPLLPYCTFGYSDSVPDEVVKSVRDALLSLTYDDTATLGNERLAVLKRALIDGYEVIDESEYDIFDDFAKTAKLPPYEDF
jgi:phosphonate transport system substrate-binding protein